MGYVRLCRWLVRGNFKTFTNVSQCSGKLVPRTAPRLRTLLSKNWLYQSQN